MAKKSKNKTTGSTRAQDDTARLTRNLSDSASQIWLAGMGALGRAQAEGNKLFEVLVKEGMTLEQSARRLAGGRAEAVRDVVEKGVSQTRERAADTWDKLEKGFEDRVQRTLTRLGVPGRDDVAALRDRVDALNAELRKANRAAAARKSASPSSAPRKATKKTAKVAAKKKPVARRTAKKPTS
ncbi:MAG: phasin family protein [Pseudomonadota bacterium]|nr:phasin family protein [Pseudomonadota bacterium]MDQ3229113.1 phasin family protein [Pseudomonadota bacterium]